MLLKIILVGAILPLTLAINPHPPSPNLPRALPAAANLLPRDPAACASVVETLTLKLATDSPTFGPAITSLALASPELFLSNTDACVDPTITHAAVSSEFSAYARSYSAWQDSHLCDFHEAWRACSDVEEISLVLFAPAWVCSTFLGEIVAATGCVPTGGVGGEESGTGVVSTTGPVAPVRPTAASSTAEVAPVRPTTSSTTAAVGETNSPDEVTPDNGAGRATGPLLAVIVAGLVAAVIV